MTESKSTLSHQNKAFEYSFKVSYNVITGCPRSGTTFLFNSLSALPHCESVSGHLLPIAISHIVNQDLPSDIYKALLNSFEFSLQDFLESVSKSRLTALHKWLLNSMSNKELYQAIQQRRVIERIVYKEPFLSFAPNFTYNALPDCRIVYIYRDGRDCANSLIRKYNILTDEKLMSLKTAEMPLGRKCDHRYVPWWVEEGSEEEFLTATPYVRAIWMWKEMVRYCHDFFSRPEVAVSNRVMLIKYEDLVKAPLQWGEAIANHCGCQMNDRLKHQFKKARVSSIGIYTKRDPKEIKAAEKIAEAELKLYGYI